MPCAIDPLLPVCSASLASLPFPLSRRFCPFCMPSEPLFLSFFLCFLNISPRLSYSAYLSNFSWTPSMPLSPNPPPLPPHATMPLDLTGQARRKNLRAQGVPFDMDIVKAAQHAPLVLAKYAMRMLSTAHSRMLQVVCFGPSCSPPSPRPAPLSPNLVAPTRSLLTVTCCTRSSL